MENNKNLHRDIHTTVQISAHILTVVTFIICLHQGFNPISSEITYDDYGIGSVILHPILYLVAYEVTQRLILLSICLIFFQSIPGKEEAFEGGENEKINFGTIDHEDH